MINAALPPLAHRHGPTRAAQTRGRTMHEVDVQVGRMVRARRILLGLSLDEVAGRIGVSFQQMQKYERGESKLCASRLHHVAQELGLQPAQFFAGLDGSDSVGGDMAPDVQLRRETMELVRAFGTMSLTARHGFVVMVQAAAGPAQ